LKSRHGCASLMRHGHHGGLFTFAHLLLLWPRRLGGWVLPLLAAIVGLAGCQRSQAPQSPSSASAARTAEGTPQIATTADQVHIEYTVFGSGEPAVVLIHDWACNSRYWKEQIEPLKAAKYTVVALNLAGHGASGRNRSGWTLERFGDDVATVVRALPNRRVLLVGHSMGGPIALEAARQLGDRVLGVIAVDSLRSLGQPPLSRHEVESRLAPFRENFVGATRELVSTSLFRNDADPKLVQKVAYDMSLAAPQAAIPSLEALLSWNPGPVLLAVHVPVRAINSDLSPTDEARIARYLPGFHADIIEHTGHFLIVEAPERFNPVLLRNIDFLVKHAHPS
jgi:pimeloyl-ACP methyl ester carboxylesterase